MPFLTVSSGASSIPDGVYPVTLVGISDPKTVTAQRGPKAGQDIQLLDWDFAIDEGDLDGTVIQSSTSTASGPKSKMFAWLTALFGGKSPAVGTSFERDQLIGRRALATVRADEGGWPRLENLGAMPAAMLGARLAAATGAPAKPVPAAVPADADADLPF